MTRLRVIGLGAALAVLVLVAMASRSAAPVQPPDGMVTDASAPAPTVVVPLNGPSTTLPRAVPTLALGTALSQTVASTLAALVEAAGDDRIAYAAALRARDIGAYTYASAVFGRVAARDGLLAPVASLRQAQAMVSAGDRAAAEPAFTAALARPDFPIVLRVAARFDAAANAAALGDVAAALSQLDRVRRDAAANSSDRALAAYEAAQLRRAESDPAWIVDALSVVTGQPWSPEARAALDLLESEQVPVSPFAAAYVRYRAYENAAARAAYGRALEGAAPADAAIAWFYLAALDEREGALTAALAAYARSLALAPIGALADDARYWRGRVFESRGNLGAAITEYDRLAEDFPRSSFVADARLRAAIGLALADEGASGSEALERLRVITLTGAPRDAAEAARWHTVFREQLGRTETAALDPRTFDATSLPALFSASSPRAFRWTATLPASALNERVTAPQDDAAAGRWLRQTFGPVVPGVAAALADRRYLLGRELVYVGEPAVGRALFQDLLSDLDSRPDDLLAVAQAFGRLGFTDTQLNAAERLLRPLTTSQRLSAPLSVLALAYPIAFEPSLTLSATANDLPVLLLAALVRQESAWDPLAVSSANALGLTQVTVPTGQQIASALGVTWRHDLLFDPEIALQFGGYYLGTQLRAFDGDLAAAVAAYNAGPGSSSRWLATRPMPGTDGFRLAVDFSETARFIARVLENYAWYRYIYAGAAAPALP